MRNPALNNLSEPLNSSRTLMSDDPDYPVWPNLDRVGREWLGRGDLVAWRHWVVDGVEAITVRTRTKGDTARFLSEVAALPEPTVWTPLAVPNFDVREDDGVWINGLRPERLRYLLEKSWFPGWQVTWCRSVEEGLALGGRWAARTMIRVAMPGSDDEPPALLIAVAEPPPVTSEVDRLIVVG